MLDVMLGILTWVGIILLILLGIALVFLLLIMFFPISYKIFAAKQIDDIQVSAKAKWLFGILRVNYLYPQPGKIIAKFLWFKVYDSSAESEDQAKDGSKNKKEKKTKKSSQSSSSKAEKSVAKDGITNSNAKAKVNTDLDSEAGEGNSNGETELQTDKNIEQMHGKENEKFLYTIHSICDKIKAIWENISYYMELLQNETTRDLFSHVCLRLGKILKSICPKHIEADIVIGTGAPDTTGYLYGIFCMLMPTLGAKFIVRPDFERAIAEGYIKISGRVTVAILIVNGLKIAFDKKLHWFIKKLKKEEHV